MLAWAMFPADAVVVRGNLSVYASSADGRRSFCASCGTGLFFRNAVLDGMRMMQVRLAALDEPDSVVPRVQVQVAERLSWVASLHAIPAFDRFPA